MSKKSKDIASGTAAPTPKKLKDGPPKYTLPGYPSGEETAPKK